MILDIFGTVVMASLVSAVITVINLLFGCVMSVTSEVCETERGAKLSMLVVWLLCCIVMFFVIRLQINYLHPLLVHRSMAFLYDGLAAFLMAVVLWDNPKEELSKLIDVDMPYGVLFLPGIVAFMYLPATAFWEHVVTKIHWI